MIEKPNKDGDEQVQARLEDARGEKENDLVYMLREFIKYPVEANQDELVTALTRYRHLWMRAR